MSNTPIYDQHGKVIGFKSSESNNNATYLNERGNVVARIRNDSTYDAKNQVRGKGDQGLKLFGN
jgi:hypothetical protein